LSVREEREKLGKTVGLIQAPSPFMGRKWVKIEPGLPRPPGMDP
jgi:hypothetical protein